MRRIVLVSAAIAVLVTGALASRAAQVGPSVRAPRPLLQDWTELRYTTAKLLLFTGEVRMTRTIYPREIGIRTDSSASLLGSELVDSWSLSTMDRESGRPVSFISVRPGKKAERWSFVGPVLERVVLKPYSGRENAPISTWRLAEKKQFAQDGTPLAARATAGPSQGAATPPAEWVHDYIAMLTRLGSLGLAKQGDEARVRIATSRGPVTMKVRVGDERRIDRILTQLGTDQRITVPLKELRIRVSPVGQSPEETRGFLDMEGETELWVDAATGTLTEISGNIPKVPGRVVIALAGFRPGASIDPAGSRAVTTDPPLTR